MSVAANRYARALLDALYPAKAEVGLQQVQSFAALLKQQPDARKFLENPSVTGGRRDRLLKAISEALGLDPRIANFVRILIERNRLPLLEEIVAQYQKLLDERMGIVRARITAASALDKSEQQAIAARLEQLTGKQIIMDVAVDPSLIGGVIAQVGSTIYDGSVRQQLQSFKDRLVGE